MPYVFTEQGVAMTGFWVFMLIMCLLTPVMMIGFGEYFMKGGPKQVNSTFGYRTTRSMKNQETWRFAHQYSGKIWQRSGLVLLPVSIVLMLFVYGKSVDMTGIAGLIIVIAQMIVMICAIPFTEAALKEILMILEDIDNFQLCAQPRVCSLTGGSPVYPRPNQPDISESWDGISNDA